MHYLTVEAGRSSLEVPDFLDIHHSEKDMHSARISPCCGWAGDETHVSNLSSKKKNLETHFSIPCSPWPRFHWIWNWCLTFSRSPTSPAFPMSITICHNSSSWREDARAAVGHCRAYKEPLRAPRPSRFALTLPPLLELNVKGDASREWAEWPVQQNLQNHVIRQTFLIYFFLTDSRNRTLCPYTCKLYSHTL